MKLTLKDFMYLLLGIGTGAICNIINIDFAIQTILIIIVCIIIYIKENK